MTKLIVGGSTYRKQPLPRLRLVPAPLRSATQAEFGRPFTTVTAKLALPRVGKPLVPERGLEPPKPGQP